MYRFHIVTGTVLEFTFDVFESEVISIADLLITGIEFLGYCTTTEERIFIWLVFKIKVNARHIGFMRYAFAPHIGIGNRKEGVVLEVLIKDDEIVIRPGLQQFHSCVPGEPVLNHGMIARGNSIEKSDAQS